MKRAFLIVMALVFGFLSAEAQDLIVKVNAAQIQASVQEISPEAVRYKRFSNPNGPTYVLPVKDIAYIRYANGETDYFQQQPATAPADTPANTTAQQPAKVATPSPEEHPYQRPVRVIHAEKLQPAQKIEQPQPSEQPQPAVAEMQREAQTYTSQQFITSQQQAGYYLRTYEIGEYYNQNGIQGVVALLNEEKTHGLIISMDELYLRWSNFTKPDLRLTGINDRMNGERNMRLVEEYITKNGLSWEDFPAFKWCKDHGEGWYLPSIDEMLLISHNYNGGNRTHFDRQARTKFNEALKDNGGKRMDRLVYYFTSTEVNEKEAFTTHMDLDPPYVINIPKYNKFLVRAVHKF